MIELSTGFSDLCIRKVKKKKCYVVALFLFPVPVSLRCVNNSHWGGEKKEMLVRAD